ncbi:type IV secretory system conjugative DNA transfer family protein [Thaumasiovibrio subtropicus]|uniref:type IV secretory system conjugative DNA transfer family protein n=1 Tax=Thaumasiovibrio subtropicus TaxID=1891207 RepID=UPI000B35E948|nr:type IV secretory system conjugative DNA transfer family protein [Thaumasiovibrio subtropicus]
MKIVGIVFLFLLLTAFFLVAGQYAAAFAMLKQAGMDYSNISYDTFYYYWLDYKDLEWAKKYLAVGYAFGGLVSSFPLIIVGAVLFGMYKPEELHGSARFANSVELRKSGLFPRKKKAEPEKPVLLLGRGGKGSYKNQLIQFEGQQFAGVEAPTRSGKGVGIVIPNALNYSESLVTLDIKLENFEKTAGQRAAMGQEVYIFCPDGYSTTALEASNGTVRSHCWNPFDYVRRDAKFRVGDLMVITNALYPTGSGGKDDMWNELAGKLFTGLSLFMLDIEKITHRQASFPYLIELKSSKDGLDKWMESQLDAGYCSDETKREFADFMGAAKETKGSILSNFNAPLAVFSDQVCAASVSKSDFDFRDLRKKKMSIYVGVKPANIPRFQKLLNLFFEQLINENTKVLPELDPALKYQCLCLLDEFPALGRVQIIDKAIGYAAGYNMRFLMIYQSEAQLEKKDVYGKEGAKALLDNLAVRVIYPPKEVTEQVKRISETLGYKTVKERTVSRTSGKGSTRTRNETKQKRALMMPQEIVELGFEKHKSGLGINTLMIMENMRPFKAKKIIYFEEKEFQAKVDYSLNNVPSIPALF